MKKLMTIYKVVCAGLLAGVFTVACTEDDWGKQGGTQGGVALSSYKEKVVSRAMEPGDSYFAQGTKYRIWIMDQGTTTSEEADEANGIEATESNRGGIPVINIRPIERTTPDFYGFTQNSTTDVPAPNQVTGTYPIALQDETNDYIDYLRGELHAPYQPEDYAQGDILQMPFRHIMSQVTFQVSKDTELETDVQLVSIEMIGSNHDNPGSADITSAGTYQVYNNEFDFTENAIRTIDGKNMDVPSADLGSDNVGEVDTVLVFPTFETTATETETRTVPLTYLRVTFKDLENYYGQQGADGNSQVIVPIYNTITSVEGEAGALEFLQNYHYTLHIAFSSDIRRVVTLVPKVYEWIEGEGDVSNDYMQEQDMGQPVTFNGVLWSDRNLGATSGNPTRSVDDWYNSIGYVYQYGRNIPYFPYDENSDFTINYNMTPREALKNDSPVNPVIDYESWGLTIGNFQRTWWLHGTTNSASLVWDLDEDRMEELIAKNGHVDFGFYYGDDVVYRNDRGEVTHIDYNKYRLDYLDGYQNEWSENKKTPCPPGWRLPTVRDFMGIMPSSGFSGNITFRVFTDITSNGSWSTENENEPDLNSAAFSEGNIENIRDDFYTKNNKPVYKGAFPYIYRKEEDDMQDGSGAIGEYILSMGAKDQRIVIDKSNSLGRSNGGNFKYYWGTIYGIKNQGTEDAYRIRWQIDLKTDEIPTETNGGENHDNVRVKTYSQNPFHGILVISRYEASSSDNFELNRGDHNYGDVIDRYDWDNPVEVMYLPIGGYCDAEDSDGKLKNIGTEVWYATSELGDITNVNNQKKKMIWIKYAGYSAKNSQTIAVSDESALGAAVFVRCVRDLYNTGNR